MRLWRRRAAAALSFGVLAALLLASAASGSFTASPSGGPLTLKTATLDSPTGLVATNQCKKNTYDRVHLTWTDPTSPAVAKIEIDRSSDGGVTYGKVKRVNPGGQVTNDTTVAGSTTYFYELVSIRNKWTSAPSNVVSITTLDPVTCR